MYSALALNAVDHEIDSQYSALALNAVDHEIDSQSDQTKDYEISVCCFSTKSVAL